MSESPDQRCSECGAPRGAAGPGSLCASCVFSLALEEEGDAGVPDARGETPDSAPPGIPGYEILEIVGRGGMGTVWRARQTSPVRRDVAVKVVRSGLDSAEIAARFEAERQALAMMDHPFVARFFDAGTTTDGRPYFVMEHVPGAPITEYCNARRLSVERRLELFASVCDTVHHAHRKGILHRDLKPSNILVVDRDGSPEPKIIDFGIAKATRPSIFDHTLMTRADQILGTPEYMSPEQMAHGERALDVRTDVYSLGAVLYELLSGALPYDREALTRGGLEDVLRTVRDVDAPTPSERVTSLGDDAGREAALARSTRHGSLVTKLRGDLDWITMRALAKEPDRRYGSAAELAEDQRRYLRREPVSAGPPGVAYRARKFVRRHPVGSSSALVLLVSVLVFAVVVAGQARRIARERDRANAQAAVSQEVTRFLGSLFREADPHETRGTELTARELLDRGARRIREEVADPAVRAELFTEIGLTYSHLGLDAEALPLLREAAEIRTGLHGPDDPRTLVAVGDRAGVENSLGHSALAESIRVDALDRWKRVAGEDDPRTLDALHDLAIIYKEQDRLDEAADALAHVLEARRRRGEADDPAAMAALRNLADVYRQTGRLDEAEALLDEAVERRARVLGEDHPLTLTSRTTLGSVYILQGRLDEAEDLLERTEEEQRRVLGNRHPDYAITLEQLATVRWMREEYEDALGDFAAILSLRRETLGPEHPATLVAMHNLGSALTETGQFAQAESRLREVLEIRRRVVGERHTFTLQTMYGVALDCALQGDRDGAVAMLGEAVRLGFAHPTVPEAPEFAWLRGDLELDTLFDEIRRRVQDENDRRR